MLSCKEAVSSETKDVGSGKEGGGGLDIERYISEIFQRKFPGIYFVTVIMKKGCLWAQLRCAKDLSLHFLSRETVLKTFIRSKTSRSFWAVEFHHLPIHWPVVWR